MRVSLFSISSALLIAMTLLVAEGGCDDEPLEEDKGQTQNADATMGDGAALSDAAESDTQTSTPPTDGSILDAAKGLDAAEGLDVIEVLDAAETPDALTTDDTLQNGDSPSGDASAPDTSNPDASNPDASDTLQNGDSPTGDASNPDTTGQDPCGICPFNARPKGPHPAAKSSTSLLEPQDIKYGSGAFQGYKELRVFKPLKPGILPVLFFVPGRRLYETGGLISTTPGHAYEALLKHVASRGYIVAYVRVYNHSTDCDRAKMRDNLLEATQKLFEKVSVADKDRVAFAGHGEGATIAVLAAAKSLSDDAKGEWPNPKAVFAFNLINKKPTICLSSYKDASKAVQNIDAKSKVRFTFVQTHDDKDAPYKAPNALAVYEGLKLKYKQVIVLRGTGKGDPNPSTKPELHDDYAAPLTVEGKLGGTADWGIPESHLDALDWYGYWKFLVGGLDYHFYKGESKWAYGALRTHGGTLPDGKIIKHEILKQGW